jgi:hypothetical protein
MDIDKHKYLRVQISITRVSDGKNATYWDDEGLYQNGEYDGTFIWEDGNFSCDCNRSIFFHKALGEPEAVEAECGESKFRVDFIKDETGKIWYRDYVDTKSSTD